MKRRIYWAFAPRADPQPWAIRFEITGESNFECAVDVEVYSETLETGRLILDDIIIGSSTQVASFIWLAMRREFHVDAQDYETIYLTIKQIMKEGNYNDADEREQ